MDNYYYYYTGMNIFLFASRRCGWLRRLHGGRGWFGGSRYIRYCDSVCVTEVVTVEDTEYLE